MIIKGKRNNHNSGKMAKYIEIVFKSVSGLVCAMLSALICIETSQAAGYYRAVEELWNVLVRIKQLPYGTRVVEGRPQEICTIDMLPIRSIDNGEVQLVLLRNAILTGFDPYKSRLWGALSLVRLNEMFDLQFGWIKGRLVYLLGPGSIVLISSGRRNIIIDLYIYGPEIPVITSVFRQQVLPYKVGRGVGVKPAVERERGRVGDIATVPLSPLDEGRYLLRLGREGIDHKWEEVYARRQRLEQGLHRGGALPEGSHETVLGPVATAPSETPLPSMWWQ
ncbi:MAG: hypothetical protein LBI20_01550 [Holosporales bacterium]|jgi:hypothetical protein|nr:hypothetical protein [Holosporales bacterium]